MNRTKIVAALLLASIPMVVPAGAQAGKTLKKLDVVTNYTEPALSFDGFECRGLSQESPSERTCQGHTVGPATFTGTMWGDVWYDMQGWIGPDGKIYYWGPDYIDGGVEGCGEGSFIIDDYDGWVDMAQYDPVTNSAPGFNRWRLRKGSGTGQLRNLVSGEGVNHWRVYFNYYAGLEPHFGRGKFTGTMTCKV